MQNEKVVLTCKSGKEVLFIASSKVTIEKSTWHPEFGSSLQNVRLVVYLDTSSLITEITWS